MKKLFKFLLTVIILAVLSGTAFVTVYAAKGYKMYIEATGKCSVEAKAEEIQKAENFVPYEDLPEFYIKAVIAVEDRRFEKHGGVDPIAVGRAIIHDIQAKAPVEGGSTITQQLAKNLYYTQEKKLERKFAEAFTAFEFERKFSKEEIFELYVNTIYFGSNYYGISEAAQGYYSTEVPELTEYECAMLAGIPNAPSAYSPDSSPELAKQRLVQVLDNMVENNDIDSVQAKEIIYLECIPLYCLLKNFLLLLSRYDFFHILLPLTLVLL